MLLESPSMLLAWRKHLICTWKMVFPYKVSRLPSRNNITQFMKFCKGINTTYINNTDMEASTRPTYPYATKVNLIPLFLQLKSSSYMLLNSWVKFIIFQSTKMRLQLNGTPIMQNTHIDSSDMPIYGYFVRGNRHPFIIDFGPFTQDTQTSLL